MSERSERYTVPMGVRVGERPDYWYAPETLAPRPLIALGYLVQAEMEIHRLMRDIEDDSMDWDIEYFEKIRLRIDQAFVMCERMRNND